MIDDLKVTCKFCGKISLLATYDQQRNFYICHLCCLKIGHEPPYTNEELVVIYEYFIKEVEESGKRKLMYGV